MARYRILCWKDIPSVVEADDGTDHVKIQLSERFQVLIDAVAMQLGLTGTGEYLDQWAHGDEQERPGTAREVAEALVSELEDRFEDYGGRGWGRP